MCFEFYSYLDPKPDLQRKLVLVITESEQPDNGEESSQENQESEEEWVACKFESSDFMQCLDLGEGYNVGMEIVFLKRDLPTLFNIARDEIDEFIQAERLEMGLDQDGDGED